MPDKAAKVDFTSTIDGNGNIACELISRLDYTIESPILSFSLLAPAMAVDNCKVIDELGGFTRLLLKQSLVPGIPLAFVIDYKSPDFKAANRAWLPLGCYLFNERSQVLDVSSAAGGVNLQSKSNTPEISDVTDGFAVVPKPTFVDLAGSRLRFRSLKVKAAPALMAVVADVEALVTRHRFEPLISENGIASTVAVDKSLRTESYHFVVNSNNIAITVADESGLFYALITLLTLRETGGGEIPTGRIEDTPRFSWRGHHLDCARHFYEVGTILRLLDVMAMLKLNRFHWHFSDDEAFRIQTDFAHSLCTDTAFRGEKQLIPGVFGGGSGPTGGSYSKADVEKVVRHARALHIEVLPEIEYPAHALCLNRRFTQLRDNQDVGVEQSVQGYLRNVVNPAIPETQEFFQQLCLEVARLFPFSHIHLGGDELPENSWDGSPVMDKFKAEHQLINAEDVQGYAMHELAAEMRAHNLVPCAWEESGRGSGGGIGNDAILFLWQGVQKFEQLASLGYRCVLSPAQYTYFDIAHTGHQSDWGANWAAYISLADTLDWEPVPDHLNQYADNCVGIQGAFWSEFTTRDKEMEAMIAPRILGLACKAWSSKGAVNSVEILSLARSYEIIFQKMNWQVAPVNLYA